MRSRELGSLPGPAFRGATKVAAAGDVNGDGIPDLLASKGEFYSEPSEGVVYVVFGSPGLADLNLQQLGDGGFVIRGASEEDEASYAAPAGDVNGDGKDDIVIGAPGADNNGRSSSGSAYVVFGKSDGGPVDLKLFNVNAQGGQGFRIDGPSGRALAGRAVDGAGDVNGDGLADIIVGAPFAPSAYVVFGQTHGMPIDLATFDLGIEPARGFQITTPLPISDSRMAVSNAGDVNGDGVPDVVVGLAPYDRAFGSAYVVFGKSDGRALDATDLGDAGIRQGGTRGSATGLAVNAAGDVNGDGFDDVMVGAPRYPYSDRPYAYVVYGRQEPGLIRLRRKTLPGFTLKAERRMSGFGEAVAAAGDVDGDGTGDFLVGAPRSDFGGRENSGAVYVVSGTALPRRVVDLMADSAVALRIEGRRGILERCPPDADACHGDQVGATLAPVGDMNADGFDDFAIAARAAGRKRDGAVYLVWGARRLLGT